MFSSSSSSSSSSSGGIGFDMADFISHIPHTNNEKVSKDLPEDGVPLSKTVDKDAVQSFINEWKIDTSIQSGGLLSKEKLSDQKDVRSDRKIYLLQRKKGKLGSSLGKTTGWIHRTTIKNRGVQEISGCEYVEVVDDGLVIKRNDKTEILNVIETQSCDLYFIPILLTIKFILGKYCYNMCWARAFTKSFATVK